MPDMEKANKMTTDPQTANAKKLTRKRNPAATPAPEPVPFHESMEGSLAAAERILQSLPAGQRDRVAAVVSRSKSRSHEASSVRSATVRRVAQACLISSTALMPPLSHSRPASATKLSPFIS